MDALFADLFNKETIQAIKTLADLMEAAEAFANERPAITDELKKQFLEKVREYAHLQGLG